MTTLAKIDYNRPAGNVTDLQRAAEPLLPQIRMALPRALADNADRVLRTLLTEASRSPALLDCSAKSLLGGVIQVAQLGLELGGATGQAYLIPFKGQAQVVIGYRGFLTLAHRTTVVRRVSPRVVREGEVFEIEYGTAQRLVHRPNPGSTEPVVGYYAVAEMANGGTDFEYRTKAEAERHRDRYALSKKGPWATHFDEMALKTCVRILGKRLPLSVEWQAAVGLDEQAEADVDQNLGALLPADARDRADELRERLAGATGYDPSTDDPDLEPKG